MVSLDGLSARQIAAGVAAGDFSAVEVAKASLSALDARENACAKNRRAHRPRRAKASSPRRAYADQGRMHGRMPVHARADRHVYPMLLAVGMVVYILTDGLKFGRGKSAASSATLA